MSKRSRSSSLLDDNPPKELLPSPTPSSAGTPGDAYHDRTKKQLLDVAASPSTEAVKGMHCSLPPHRNTLAFSSYEDYEVHYLQVHVNRCSECGNNFPTDRFLNLHIEENHDPLAVVRRGRGEKTYGCFVEGCDRKCSTPQKRRMHLVDKHMFPRTYNFYIVNDGIDKQTTMLRTKNTHRRRMSMTMATSPGASSSHPPPLEGRLRHRLSVQSGSGSGANDINDVPRAQNEAQVPLQPPPSSSETGVDELEKSMASLRFVPVSVTRNRGGKGR